MDATTKTCVLCDGECNPAPTERGWIHQDYKSGIHFDCIERYYEILQAMRLSGATEVVSECHVDYKGA